MRAFLILLAFAAPALGLDIEPLSFTTASGETVDAELGHFTAPLHHDEPEGATTRLAFVRFPSTAKKTGPPIVYLAGGPGGSGIGAAKGPRFPLFMALRAFGDVIAFDQRGTGQSGAEPGCRAAEPYPTSRAFTQAEFLEYAEASVIECQRQWAEQGVDLSAYNSWESAGDLDVLRRELGADKLVLWGISYGTHLAMAAIRRLGDERIDRVILASPEALDQTVKLPSRWDAYLERLAARVADDPVASRAFPDIVGTLRQVLTKLAAEPATVMVDLGGDEPAALSFGPLAPRYMLSFMGKNPNQATRIPALIYGLAAGYHDPVADVLKQVYGEPTGFRAMPLAMDVASGISKARLSRVREEARTALIGDVLNYPMPHLQHVVDVPDLGDGFRSDLTSGVPALILTGTLDGRTFPEAHAEALAQFRNGHQIVIENAGHDLFMVSPEVTAAIEAFMLGKTPPDRIEVAMPAFFVPGQ